VYAPLQGRLKAVKIVFAVLAALSVVAAVSDLLELLLLDKLIAGEDVSDAQIDASDARQALMGGLQFLVYVAAAVVFIMWLYRAYRNTDALRPPMRRYGHGWAIGGWFVPIMWFFRPKQVVNDVWRAGGHLEEPSGLLALWWGMWLVTTWVANIALRNGFTSDTLEDSRNTTIAYLISDTLDAPTAILAILVAATLTRRLDARRAEPARADDG
jgi:hypothetical protein